MANLVLVYQRYVDIDIILIPNKYYVIMMLHTGLSGAVPHQIVSPDRDSTPTAVCLFVCLSVRHAFLKSELL